MRRLFLTIAIVSLLITLGNHGSAPAPGTPVVETGSAAALKPHPQSGPSNSGEKALALLGLRSYTGHADVPSHAEATGKIPGPREKAHENPTEPVLDGRPGNQEPSSDGPAGKAAPPRPESATVSTETDSASTDGSAPEHPHRSTFVDALVHMLFVPGAPTAQQAPESLKLALPRPKALMVRASPIPKQGPKKPRSHTKAAVTKDLAIRPETSRAAFVPGRIAEPTNPAELVYPDSPVGPMSPFGPYDPEGVIATFQNPVEPAVMSSGFGGPRGNGPHLGIDLCGPIGTPVLAAGHGRVVYAGALPPFGAYGAIVVIDHGCGVYTLYGHVDPDKSLLQKRGPRSYVPTPVTVGTPIAAIGKHKPGESSSGPHLHFEIMVIKREEKRVRYTFVNAAHYLPFARKALEGTRSATPGKALPGRATISASPNRALWAVLNTLEYPVEVYSAQIEDTAQEWESRLALGGSALATPDLLASMAAIRTETRGSDGSPLFVHASVSLEPARPVKPKKTPPKEHPKTSVRIQPATDGHQTAVPIPSHLCPPTSRSTHDLRVRIYPDLPWVPVSH